MTSDSAPPTPPSNNNKGNLPADKVVLPNADNEEEEECDIIMMTKVVFEPLTPQAFKGKGKRK